MATLVRDIMHKGLLTCRNNASLGQVASLLTKHHIHALVVMDETDVPLGIISDFDLLAGEWLSTDAESLEAMRRLTAGDLMSRPIESIEADTSLAEAANRMREKQVHRMLVTEAGVAVGVVSVSNFVENIAAQEQPKRSTVGDVMSDTFLVCRDKTTILSAARTITQAGWRSVIVVDSRGRPLGVVSGVDLLKLVGKALDENLLVSDLMNRDLVTVNINASLQEAANLMIHNHRHRLIVVDTHDPESFPLGMISSFDIVAEMARPGSVWQV